MPKGPKGQKRPPTWTATRTLIEHVADRLRVVRLPALVEVTRFGQRGADAAQ
jgi:hypothetical protein